MAAPRDRKGKSPGASDANRKSAVTIYDVASKAGVSAMTVSRVINDQKYVSEATREKVWAAVQALNFSPNLAARAARAGMVRIGALYTNPTSSNLGQFLMGAFQQSAESACQLLIEPCPSEVEPMDAVPGLLHRTGHCRSVASPGSETLDEHVQGVLRAPVHRPRSHAGLLQGPEPRDRCIGHERHERLGSRTFGG